MKSLKIIAVALLLFVASCGGNSEKTESKPAAAPATPAPKPDVGPLGEMAVPADNAITPEKVELGKKLFFDTRLSSNGRVACSTCRLHPHTGKAMSSARRASSSIVDAGRSYSSWGASPTGGRKGARSSSVAGAGRSSRSRTVARRRRTWILCLLYMFTLATVQHLPRFPRTPYAGN